MIVYDHLQHNRLAEAIEAAQEQVRSRPADAEARSLLGLLYVFDAEFSKADRHFAAASQQSSDLQVGVSLIRQLLRAEASRQDVFFSGGVPELLTEPDQAIESLLAALVAERENDENTLQAQIQSLRDSLPHLMGTVNGQHFENLCDLDDYLSHFLEVCSLNGRYYWVPFRAISSVSFEPPEKLQDQIWRTAELSLSNGFQGTVYVPTRYCMPSGDTTLRDALKLGGETDWISRRDGGPVRGVGQKTFLFGENALPIMEIEQFTIDGTD